jgi:tetratricopeptide (TPR) repeat protein
MAQTARIIATLLLGGMLISVTVQSYDFFDRSHEKLIGRIAEGLLQSSPDPAILISMGGEDRLLHALWLSQLSKNIGRNIITADIQLITEPWYREKIALPPGHSAGVAASDAPDSGREMEQLVELSKSTEGRTVLVFANSGELEGILTGMIGSGLHPVPRGLAIELRREAPADKVREAKRSATFMDRLLSEVSGELKASPEYPAIRTYSASVANLGLFLENAGLSDESELRYRQAVEIDSTFAWPRILLARLLAGRGEVEAALNSLRKSVRIDPDNPVSLLELGRALVAADSLEAAKKALVTSLELDPKSACGWYTLGSIYMEEDQLNEAMKAFEKAKELDPTSEFVHSCLSYIYLQLGHSDELVGEVRRWLDGHSGDLSTRLSLAKALKLHGDFNEAKTEFSSVIANSNDPALISEARREIRDIDRMISSTGIN